MSIDATTLDDSQLTDFIFRFSDSATWNGHVLDKAEIDLTRRIMDLLCHENWLSEFLAFKLAWIGSFPGQRPLIEKEIVHLVQMGDGDFLYAKDLQERNGAQLVSIAKSVKQFWKDHKTEIIIGTIIVATAIVVVGTTVYTGGAGTNAAIALGASAVNEMLKDPPKESVAQKTSVESPPSLALPEFSISSDVDLAPPSVIQPFNVDAAVPIKPFETPTLDEICAKKVEQDVALDPLFPNQQSYFPFNNPTLFEIRPPASTAPMQSDLCFKWNWMRAPEPCSPPLRFPYTIDPEWGPIPYTTWTPSNESKNFEVSGEQLAHGRFGAIFGINTSQVQNEIYTRSLSALANNSHFDCTYNASHSLLVDLAEATHLNYNGYSAPAKLLIDSWTKFAKDYENDPHAKYFQICHSQGAIHVKNALEQCPEELRKKVIVLAIAPGEVVPKSLCYDSYNYASSRDLVYYGKLVTQGFYGPDNDERNQKNALALKELVILDAHPDAPLFDHGIESPTFKEIIQRHTEIFMNKYGMKK